MHSRYLKSDRGTQEVNPVLLVGQHKESGAESSVFLQTIWLEQDGCNHTSFIPPH